MKKMLFIAAIAVAGLTSCKKDYDCTCNILGQTTVSPIQNVSKGDAEDACNAMNTSAALLGGSCTLN